MHWSIRFLSLTLLVLCALPTLSVASNDAVQAALDRGRDAMRAKDYARAAAEYERATGMRADDPEIWFKLGIARGRLGAQQAAIEAYRKVIELDGGHARAHHNLGNIHFRLGDLAASAEAYGRALEADPDYLLAAFHYGWVLRQLNEADQAEAVFERCLEIPATDRRGQKAHADCLFGLGSLRHRKGDYKSSAKMMEQVVTFYPAHPEARYYLGMAYRQLGRMDEAREQLEIHAQIIERQRAPVIEKQVDP